MPKTSYFRAGLTLITSPINLLIRVVHKYSIWSDFVVFGSHQDQKFRFRKSDLKYSFSRPNIRISDDQIWSKTCFMNFSFENFNFYFWKIRWSDPKISYIRSATKFFGSDSNRFFPIQNFRISEILDRNRSSKWTLL